jgi:hypothetical protein
MFRVEIMKNLRSILIIVTVSSLLSSCTVWNKVFGPKYGCPSDGRNVGAEKLLSGDMSKQEAKRAKKAKFRG